MKLHNHEVWHTCLNCAERFDRRQTSDICPQCGTVASTNKKRRFSIIVLLTLLVMTTSCSVQKHAKHPTWRRTEYRNPDRSMASRTENTRRTLRKWENHLAQRVIQHPGTMKGRDQWLRIYMTQERRPKKSWPIEWLQ